ncbi:hypothetical protein CBM2589_B100071 [Cupriavidus taiwanensis]|uniref:Uncharacterized protein n=1 Tax=Cupriavidus taiwanensis TaxID=164546 RepID=A0A375BFL6_9BURK|nr:hypothetical protein CBM2589_B100071 [Cupriavidus taiwanensis]
MERAGRTRPDRAAGAGSAGRFLGQGARHDGGAAGTGPRPDRGAVLRYGGGCLRARPGRRQRCTARAGRRRRAETGGGVQRTAGTLRAEPRARHRPRRQAQRSQDRGGAWRPGRPADRVGAQQRRRCRPGWHLAVPGRCQGRGRQHQGLPHHRQPARRRYQLPGCARAIAGRSRQGLRAGRTGGGLRRGAAVRRGRGCDGHAQRRDARIRQDAPAVRRADRALPGAAAPHGRDVHPRRAVALDHAAGRGALRGGHAGTAPPLRLRRQGARGPGRAHGRAGGGADPRRHGRDQRAAGRAHVQAADDDQHHLRRRGPSPGQVCRPAGVPGSCLTLTYAYRWLAPLSRLRERGRGRGQAVACRRAGLRRYSGPLPHPSPAVRERGAFTSGDGLRPA